MTTLDQNYDKKIRENLEKRLNRPAKEDEIINSDKDSDLVGETLWQILIEMEKRIEVLEKKSKDIKTI
jgi:hypothetical protein